MNKVVNIKAFTPIIDVKPNIFGIHQSIQLSTEDIHKCIMRKAIVEEVLNDGSFLRLNLKNYNTDNNPVVSEKVVKEIKVITKKSKKITEKDETATVEASD